MASTPRAYEQDRFPWHLQLIPEQIPVGTEVIPHPGRSSAVFVVHGIGQQVITETAATLRSGFEDALDAIRQWQDENQGGALKAFDTTVVPPPLVHDGFWANYQEFASTFPDDWAKFGEAERRFFTHLWTIRTSSLGKTCLWVFRHQLRLLSPSVLKEVGPLAWLLYIPLQIACPAALFIGAVRYPRVVRGVLEDVRLYLDPKGMAERAIVQRIDYRVGREFLRMLGLDWDFRPLPDDQTIQSCGRPVRFERVVWVAHSLGTVISYNVLSDLFYRAAEVERTGDEVQKHGAERFRATLRRFITLGSPLDKVAFLFKGRSIRPWPTDRSELLRGGERRSSVNTSRPSDPAKTSTEWWINFYHVLDPVSGALSNPLICGVEQPVNMHIKSGIIPGLAHLAYWRDADTMRYLLGRTYGRRLLRDRELVPWPAPVLTALAAGAYLVWAVLLVGMVYGILRYGPGMVTGAVKGLLGKIF